MKDKITDDTISTTDEAGNLPDATKASASPSPELAQPAEPITPALVKPKITDTPPPALPEMKDIMRSEQAYLTEKTTFLDPVIFQQQLMMAKIYHDAKALPEGFKNPYQILMAIQAGAEMGMSPTMAVKSFYFVRGTLTIYGPAVGFALKKHGYRITEFKDEPEQCKVTVVSAKDPAELYTETFTFEEAKKSGYTGSSNGLKTGWIDGANRKNKLRYGALSRLVKFYLPEVLGAAVDIKEAADDYYASEDVMRETQAQAEKEYQQKIQINLDDEAPTDFQPKVVEVEKP